MLCVVHEAVATCAWVLWVQDDRVSYLRGERSAPHMAWSLLGASAKEADCQRKLRSAVAHVTKPDQHPSDTEVLSKVEGDTVSLVFLPKAAKPTETPTQSQILRYFCLPDTVDPRHPQALVSGKQRQ